MEKNLVEIRMQSEYHFRRSCRELLDQDTENDFWKRCFCEICFRGLRKELTGEWEIRNTPFDVELYRTKLVIVERYRQRYLRSVPRLIDLQGILTEYRRLREGYPGIPEPVRLRVACVRCLNMLMDMTPVRILHSEEFLGGVQKTGIEAYAARMEVLYHVWKQLHRDVENREGGTQ